MTNNPFSDPDYLIDYNLRAKDVKAGRASKRKGGDREETATASNAPVSNYRDLEFELQAPRDGNDKEIYTFDKSLERLQSAGFERHPRSAEAFTLLADSLEGKLNGNVQKVSEDMLSSYGEWFSLAFERKGDILLAYIDPKDLIWNEEKEEYEKKRGKFDYSDLKRFNIAGKESDEYIDLEEFDENLIRFLYGRPFNKLPQEMREGDKRAQVYLPPEGAAWPVARDGYGYCGVCGYGGASRGVRPSQKNLHRKRR